MTGTSPMLFRCTPIINASKRYDEEAERTIKAIDIAIEKLEQVKSTWFKEGKMNMFLVSYRHFTQLALNPEPRYRLLASIKSLVNKVTSLLFSKLFQVGKLNTRREK